MAFMRIYFTTISWICMWSLTCWSVHGQAWIPSSGCPCTCTYASGPQLTLALQPGSYKQVDCRYQNLESIPNNLPSDTEVLLLANNNIRKITNLRNVGQLEYLDLSHNHISRILDGTFQNNNQLKYLSLSWNQLQYVSDSAFQSQRHLLRLLLSGNQLGSIPQAVQSLPSLVAIDLTNNGITRVLSNSFENLQYLQFINLRSNLIRSIQADAFAHLPSLVNLQLSQNNLALLRPDAFRNVSRLSSLSLGYNAFKALPANQFDNIPSLEVIHLEGNQITNLPGTIFQSLSNLQEINLEENGLDVLPSDIFRGRQSLQKIRLAGNEPVPPTSSDMFNNLPNLVSLSLSQIPMPLDSLPSQLLELRITDSSLSSIPRNFLSHMTSLESLVLSENMISDIEDGAFDGLRGLRLLDVSGNNLTSVPDWMFAGNFTSLETILLQENRIERIFPRSFTSLVNLRSLTLEANQIKELPPGVFPSSLEYLQLGDNPIQFLDVEAISHLTQLRLFSVNSRNFQCDCRLKHFKDWLSLNQVIVDGAVELQCKTPTRLRGVSLLRLNQRQVYCGPPRILTTPKVQNVTVRMGFNITLPCSLLPYSVASLTWKSPSESSLTMSNVFKTSYQINNYQLMPTGTLIVLNVTPLDGGTYTCTADNPSGSDVITYFVNVYREKQATTPHPTTPPTTYGTHNGTEVIMNGTTILPPVTVRPPPVTVRPTVNNLNPVTQVVGNVTTLLPGSSLPNTTTLNVISNVSITGKLTTVKTTTKLVINVPTTTPTVTNVTIVDQRPKEREQNSTNPISPDATKNTPAHKFPQFGVGQKENSTISNDASNKKQDGGISDTTLAGSTNRSIPTLASTVITPVAATDSAAKETPGTNSPCNPNPCLHRGRCKVVNIRQDDDTDDDSLQYDSYSDSANNGNDQRDEVDAKGSEVKAHCICRKKFGGPTCEIRKPEVPHHVTVLDTDDDVITLKWDQKNMANVDGYRIYFGLAGEKDMSKTMPIHPEVKSYTMVELDKESTYRICVVAFNDGGDSPVGDKNCVWANTKSGPPSILALLKTEYGIIGGGVLFVIMLTLLTAICYARGKKERDYERSVVIPRVSQSVADLPPSNVFRRSAKPRESPFYKDDLMLLDLSQQNERKMYMNPFDSRHSIATQDNEHINPPLGFGEGIPASLMPNNSRRTLRIQEDMV